MRTAGKLALATTLLLAAGPVRAVDVDRIEIHSRLGEPLRAEIPIVGARAADLAQLQAQLASATTFARIGLPRPQGVVAGLRFDVVRGPRPVIRVTSDMPVQEEFLTFLVQIDAPQGRLVREYSLALGAAPSLVADGAPAIQAPAVAPGSTIARQPDPAAVLPNPALPALDAPMAAAPPEPALLAAPPIPVVGRSPRTSSAGAAPAAARSPLPRTPPAGTAARRAPPVPQAPGVRASGGFKVAPGDTLTGIVGRMGIEGATVPQSLLAVLRANPQAFGAGNINLLRHGAVLRAPVAAELTRLDAAAAEALVRLHTARWRSGDLSPIAPPASSPHAAETVAPIPVVADAAAPARLEIAAADEEAAVPAAPGSTATAAGAADRERAAADLLAARYTEFQQMQQRIAELEQAQQAQQRLLLLRERQLAARPQVAGAWPWLLASLALGAALTAAWRLRVAPRPGRAARALASRVRGPSAQGDRPASR